MMRKEYELEPCPVCGSTVMIDDAGDVPMTRRDRTAAGRWFVRCSNMRCDMEQIGMYSTRAYAAKAWNRERTKKEMCRFRTGAFEQRAYNPLPKVVIPAERSEDEWRAGK